MTRLVLLARDLARVRRHAAGSYPAECCGILVGGEAGNDVVVDRLVAAPNAALRDATRRYVIPPELLLATHRTARAAARKVVGYYHSHPDRPARPSSTDRRHAWPGVSYLIVSVGSGGAGEVRSWRLDDGGSDFCEEPWKLADSPP